MSRKRTVLLEAAANLIEAAGGSMPITTLNKALFYLDIFALRDFGEPITGTAYIALPAGPVVARYDKRLVAALEDEGIAQQDISEESGGKPICLLKRPSPETLDSERLALVRRIGQWASTKTAKELSDLSHQNDGWRIAWDEGLGARLPARSVNLRIAMQQIIDIDPWVDEAPKGDVATAFSEAESEEGEAF